LPAALLTVVAALVLRFYAVPLMTTITFGTYVLLGIVLPGTLVWRAVRPAAGTVWFVAEAAAGTALGYACEVLAYTPARAVNLPLLVLAWPLGTVLVFVAVPKLRRHFRSAPGGERAPAPWVWSITGAVALVLFWSCKFFRLYGLSWPYYSAPDTDSTFHLALLGEAKHHMPLTTPWVSGEPLFYHWFVYAEMAATSWVTGIEPQILLLRLSMLPMLAAFTVLVAVLARRIIGHWWTGVVAVAGTLFVLAPSPYGWQLNQFFTGLAFSPIDDGSALRLTVWTSPTQTFGAMLFVPVVLVLVDLLGGALRQYPKKSWVLLGVLLCAVMGAKASYLPLLLAGLLLVVVVQLMNGRGPHRPALVATAITFACLLFAQFVLFGGATLGLRWDPLADVRTSGIGTTGFLIDPRPWRLALVALIAGWCWFCIWSGISGLVRRRRVLEPEILLLLGIGIAGIGATMLFGQSGDSQRFFVEAARPYLTLAAVAGLAAVLGRPRRHTGFALLVAAFTGMFAVFAIRVLDGPALPTPWNTPGSKHLALQVFWPYALTFGVAVAATIAVGVARRRVAMFRGIGHALIVALVAGFGLATTYSNFARVVRESSTQGWRNVLLQQPAITVGTLEAGRWLRDHSDPADLVATNAHCRPVDKVKCTNLHFSVAAYSERQMLVEGWGFTATAHVRAEQQRIWMGLVPYWKPEVLAANDAVFTSPSVENADFLRDRYGVRWLFVDETQGAPSRQERGQITPPQAPAFRPPSARLVDVADLRFRSGYCAIYQIRPAV
jgi:hypothetical protein